MVTTDAEVELRQQLKEAGKQLSNPPSSVDDLLHILDQTEKLLSKVDQSPNSLMQDALNQPLKALIDKSLLKHSNTDAKVSVAACICEIMRITAPDAPYSDEEMKDVFLLIVSSFENLSDESSRTYDKRISIIDTVCKVRLCVIMLDLECDDLIVKMFQHFLTSVRDHHLGKVFLSMRNIMALVLEESEDISLDILKPLLSSMKNNSEGVLPVARKLGEEVVKRSADKLQPCLKQALKNLGVSLDNYSEVLTLVYKGITDFEHNYETSPVDPKADTSKLAPALDDSAQVISNGKIVASLGEGSDDKESEETIDDPDSNPTSSVAKKSVKLVSKPESTSNRKGMKSSELANSSHDDARSKTGKATDIPLSDREEVETEAANVGAQSQSKSLIKKVIGSNKKSSGQTPLANVSLMIEPEGIKDSEVRSVKRVRKKTPKAEDNKPSATSGSDVEPQKKAPEVTSDSEIRSQKRARKKTAKGDDYKPSATSGSDVEPLKSTSKKVDAVGSESKLGKRSIKKVGGAYSMASGGSDTEIPKKLSKKLDIGSGPKRVRSSGTKVSGDSVDTSDLDAELLNKKVETVDSGLKSSKRSTKKAVAKESVADKAKQSGKKTDGRESQAKKSKSNGEKVDEGDLEVKLPKQSDRKGSESYSDDKPLKQSGKKGVKRKITTKSNEDILNEDEESNSDNEPLKVSAKKDESDSDNRPLKLVVKKGNKSSSVVKSSSEKKAGKKNQAKSVAEDDGMNVTLKSALKTATKGEGKLKEDHKISSKRKQSDGKVKENTPQSSQVSKLVEYDDSLVGQKVKVWWPKDKTYYEGVITSFDAVKSKHKVLYLDGMEENLVMRKQKWEAIEEYSAPYEENVAEVEDRSVDDAPDTPKKKILAVTLGLCVPQEKSKVSAKQSAKKSKVSAKRARGASVAGKSEVPASKSGGGNKDKEGKVDNKSEAVILKESDNLKEAEETKKKEERQNIVYKSKGKGKNRSKTIENEEKAVAREANM
uniref:protein IWS1 homolog n=1 Tax=Erigeron canadensis TaxID=72917 RepID=UPI001CB93B0B|nr:protein IWS1 homolog [Erigeron canadensis]